MMKKLLIIACAALLPAAAGAQAVIAFDSKTHDFGTIEEADGRVSHDFVFENQGNAPLVISKVQASCGCTTPSWTKSPVEPGQKGKITVTYNPAGRPGNFNKSISVQSNATVERERLVIKGNVNPKPRGEARAAYRVAMGSIRLTAKDIAFGNVAKGTDKQAGLKVKNASNAPVRLSFLDLPPYVTCDNGGVALNANAEAELKFTFDTRQCPAWGPVDDHLYIALDGKEDRSDTYRVALTANVTEDFSHLTLDERRTAPILEMTTRTASLGTVAAGTKHNVAFALKNVGQRPLEVRRVISQNQEITPKAQQLTVKGGRTAEVRLTVDTSGQPAGHYNRTVTLQTNDPQNAYVVVSIAWDVE